MPAVLIRPIFVSHGYINIFTFLSHLNNLYKDFIFLHISEEILYFFIFQKEDMLLQQEPLYKEEEEVSEVHRPTNTLTKHEQLFQTCWLFNYLNSFR